MSICTRWGCQICIIKMIQKRHFTETCHKLSLDFEEIRNNVARLPLNINNSEPQMNIFWFLNKKQSVCTKNCYNSRLRFAYRIETNILRCSSSQICCTVFAEELSFNLLCNTCRSPNGRRGGIF